MLPELIELNRIRLEEDKTYIELATAIGLEHSSLNRLLRDQRAPQDRTLYKIRRFLDSRRRPKARRTREAAA